MEDNKIECPECGEEIKLNDKPEMGDISVCDGCGVEMEVVNTDPIEVEAVVEEK